MTAGPGAPYLAVIGPADAGEEALALGEAVGREAARRGAVVVTGGRGGVMAAASRGAASERGVVVGILPGPDRSDANEWLTVGIATGMGELRNGLVARAGDAVVAIDGGWGTLSEIGFALRIGRPVVGLGTWEIEGVERVDDPVEAVALALSRLPAA